MKHWVLVLALFFCPEAYGLDQTQLTEILALARSEMDMPGVRAAVRYADGSMVLAAEGFADVEAVTLLDDSVGMPGGSTGIALAGKDVCRCFENAGSCVLLFVRVWWCHNLSQLYVSDH